MNISVYLDQNVFGHFYDTQPNWTANSLASELLRLRDEEKAEVWISPTHVLELCQATDHERRSKIAKMMLELGSAKRMWAGPDFFLVREFGNFLNNVIPGVFHPEPFVDKYQENAVRIWLGYLGLLASVPEYELGPGLIDIHSAKAQTQLLHARIAADPEKQFQLLIDAAQTISTTPILDPLNLNKMTDEEIQQEILVLRSSPVRINRQTLKKVEKHRTEISTVYGAIGIGPAMDAVFQYPCDLELTFDIPLLVSHWGDLQSRFSCPNLPEILTNENPLMLRADRNTVVTILNAAISAAARGGLSSVSVGYYTLMRELEIKLNQGELPTEGVGFDMDHASAAMHYQVFVCHDELLKNNVKTYIKRTGQEGSRRVVSNARQLLKAVESLSGI